jgi:hypothetical protein
MALNPSALAALIIAADLVGAGVVRTGVVGADVVEVGVVGGGAAGVVMAVPPPQPTFNDRIPTNISTRLSFKVTSKYSC